MRYRFPVFQRKCKSVILLLVVLSVLDSCTRTLDVGTREFEVAEDENVRYLCNSIDRINLRPLDSLYTKFTVESNSPQGKFKASGEIQFNNNPTKMRVVFHDAVFMSPITELIQDDDIIKLYFHLENTLYVDKVKTIDLKLYTNIDFDFSYLYDLAILKIPLISDYSVKKGLRDMDNGESGKIIILENKEYFETISFEKDIPDRIKWVNKKTKEEFEVYLNKPSLKEGILYYKNIRIKSPSSDLKLDIQINRIKLNVPLNLKEITNIKLQKNVKIIPRY